MASQYSILRQYTPYVSPYNIDLIKDVTMYKQQKVDASRERIYSQIDYLMGQEIDKPEARAYMEDKMSNVIANINEKFKGVDLSSDGVTRAIQGEISTVLDDTVINAIAGTKEGKRMRNSIESIKQNHPELYSPINEWYAMNPYYQWRSDGKAGSRLGSLHYSPYVDYNKEMNKIIADFRKNNKGKKIPTTEYDVEGNPTGGIIEVNMDELTDTQIRNIVSANLSENMRNQMRIEASYMAATNPVFSNQKMVGEYLTSHLERYDNYIGALMAKKASVGDNKTILDQLDSQIQETKNRQAEVKREVEAIIKTADPIAAANFVVTSNLFDKMSDAWRYDNTSFERKKDEVYFARLDEERKQKKFLTDNAKALADIEKANEIANQKRIENEYMLKYGRKMGTKGSAGSDGEGGDGSGGGAAVTNAGTGNVGSVNVANLPYEQLNAATKDYRANLLKLYNSLSEEDRRNIIAAADQDSKTNPGMYMNMSPEEKVYAYLKNNGGQKNDYFGRGNNRLSESYDALRASEAKMNGASSAIEDLTNYQIANLVTEENINNIVSVIGDENRNKAGSYLLGIAAMSATSNNGSAWRGAIHPTLGLLGLIPGFPEFFTGGYGTDTGTLALINGMKKLNGDPDFNIADYLVIDENGEIDIKDPEEGEPVTITQLRRVRDRFPELKGVYDQMKDAIDISVSPDQVSDYLSHSKYLDSYLRYTWNADATKDDQEKAEIQALSGILAGKIKGLDPTAIKSIDMDTEIDDGVVRRYLTADVKVGDKINTTERVEVTDDEFKRNGFDMSSRERNYPVEGYKSIFGTCNFVDTEKKEGRSYDKYLVDQNRKGIIKQDLTGLASKNDVKNDLYDILKSSGSYLKQEDMDVMREITGNFVDMADNISVQLEGVNDRGTKEVVVNFYDKRTINSANPTLLFSDFVPLNVGGDEYADELNNILEICPQFFYVKYVKEALAERLQQMRDPYIRQLRITPNNNDKFGKLNSSWIKFNSNQKSEE